MPLEFQTALPPHVFGIPVQETPPLPRNSKMPPVVWYGYFLESPNVGLEVSRYFLVTSYITHSFLLNSIQVNNEREWSVKKRMYLINHSLYNYY